MIRIRDAFRYPTTARLGRAEGDDVLAAVEDANGHPVESGRCVGDPALAIGGNGEARGGLGAHVYIGTAAHRKRRDDTVGDGDGELGAGDVLESWGGHLKRVGNG